jgi:formylglycine-generating enzyme required for sulfatase activity
MRDDGYETPSLWPDSMLVEGALLDRAAALSRFTDLTGARGPRTWSGSVFPSGSGDHPVNGVSWYEARAYCLWQGKRLPSAAQWWRAALGAGERPYPWGGDSESLRARANFEGSGTVPVESLPLGVSPFGAFEMAGNVREWVRPDGAEALTALSVGGSWQDPVYTFTPEWREELPLGFANETTGFRCVRHAE